VKVFIASDRRHQTVQFLLELPGLSGLKEACVEQGKPHVTQCKDANDKKEVPAPEEKWTISGGKSHPSLNSNLHGIALAVGLVSALSGA